MIEKMTTTNTKPTYASLKHREEELLAQLKELKEEIAIAENDIVTEKLNTALQCLADVDKMTSGYYRCTIETYCEGCEDNIDIDVDLAEIICALQRII
jgi:hypothetical protein